MSLYVFADARQRRGQQKKEEEKTAQTVANPIGLARQFDGLRSGMDDDFRCFRGRHIPRN